MENFGLGRVVGFEEIPKNSIVTKTSPFVPRTLGMEDFPSSAKEARVDDVLENYPRQIFASLFADNKNLSNGIQLYKIE